MLATYLTASTTEGAQGAAGAAAHGGEAAGHGGGVPPFDPNYVAPQSLLAISTFGLFYRVMTNVVLPRIGGILEVRRDRIAGDLDQAARLKEEADAAIAAYEQELATAKASANEIGQKARDEARASADEKRREVETSLNAKLAESEAHIATIRDKALGEVDAIATDVVTDIMAELLGAKVTAAEAAAAVKG